MKEKSDTEIKSFIENKRNELQKLQAEISNLNLKIRNFPAQQCKET